MKTILGREPALWLNTLSAVLGLVLAVLMFVTRGQVSPKGTAA